VERTTYGFDGHLCRHVERHGGKEDTELKGVVSTEGNADETLVCNWQDEEDKEKTCQEILAMLQSCISDSHPRVRYAVIYTIGQMALAFEVSVARIASKKISYWADSKIETTGGRLSRISSRCQSASSVLGILLPRTACSVSERLESGQLDRGHLERSQPGSCTGVGTEVSLPTYET
jgi:hypothetical protein